LAKDINLSVGVIFIIFFSSITVISTPMSSTTVNWASNFRPHGGFADELLFVMYPFNDYNQVIYSLLRGEIDAYAGQIPVNCLPGLLTDPNISVQIEPSSSFRIITLNCGLFPANITGYRRALAYSIDKHKIIIEAIGGAGKPFDSYIPSCAREWEIESSMTEHFYEKDIAKGNASLETAKFKDLDSDGWREYDVNSNDIWDETIDVDDQECAIQITVSKGFEPALISSQVVVEGLHEMGMRATIFEQDFSYLCGPELEKLLEARRCANRMKNRITGIDCIPDYSKWQAFCFTLGFYPPSSMYYCFHSSQTYHNYFFRLNNASINKVLDAMMDATTLEEAKAKAIEAAKMLVFEQPMIVCYNNININAYRTNRFEGFFRFSGEGFTGANPYMGTKVYLKKSLGGPVGGTLRIAMTKSLGAMLKGLESTNILWVTEGATTATMVMNYIYEGLWQVDPHTLDPIPGLAYNWTTEQTSAGSGLQAGQKFTFKLYKNATWHDGKNVTSADVKYTWENVWPSVLDVGYILNHVYKVEAPDDYTVEIYSNNTGYFEWLRATGALVLPKHIWEPHEPNYGDWKPESSDIIGSGPYKWNSYTPGKNISLLRHDDWRWREEELPTQPSTSSIDTVSIFIGFGTVVIILYFRKRK
jgi:ABC-type transport system substrate-binding protein